MATRERRSAARVEYARLLTGAFEAAVDDAGLVERDLVVAGRRVRVELAGDALLSLVEDGLRTSPAHGAPDAVVRVWDDASTGTRLPPFPWSPRDVGRQGAIDGWSDARIRAVYHGDITSPPDYGFNALSMYDAGRREALFWVSSVERLPWTELAEPLRPSLHWTLAAQDRHLVHAAAVRSDAGAALLAGKGWAGKTTTAMACVQSGLGLLGDNYVVLWLDEGAPHVDGLYPSIKLRSDSLELLPGTGGLEPLGDRLVARPPLAAPAEVKAVLVLERTDGPTRVRPTTAHEALFALAPSSIYQLPTNGGAGLRPIAELVRSVPVYTLELGPQPADAPAVIAEVLA